MHTQAANSAVLLQEGSLLELMNLVPLGGLSLSLCPICLVGVEGWDALAAAVLHEWCNHVAHTQVGYGGVGMPLQQQSCASDAAILHARTHTHTEVGFGEGGGWRAANGCSKLESGRVIQAEVAAAATDDDDDDETDGNSTCYHPRALICRMDT